MRKLIVSILTSLDGVMQAPGGPSEDPSGNFALVFCLRDDPGMDLSAAGFDGKDESLYWVAKPTKYSRQIPFASLSVAEPSAKD
jgi:hypothetical protein